MKLSIRMKIFLPVVILLIGFPLATWATLRYSLEVHMNFNARRDLEAMVRTVDGVLEKPEDGEEGDTVLSRLRDAGVTVYRTDLQGDIICTSDGAEVTFRTAKNTAPQEGRKPDQEEKEYILNTNTMKFHAPGCSSAAEMGPENKKEFKGTREELLDQGYSPCGRCKP